MKFVKKTKNQPESLAERTHQELRNEILSGNIAGGTRLVETTLAEQMKVSRTPIREALRQLELEGLLYSIPRVGYIVEEMSTQDVLDLFNARTAIEQITAQWAAEKINQEELDLLKQNLKESEVIIRENTPEQLTELDIEFHNILYKACRNKTLYQICQMLSDHTLKFRQAMIHLPEISQKTLDGHRKIYEAIVAKNIDLAGEQVRKHLELARKDIVVLLENFRQKTF